MKKATQRNCFAPLGKFTPRVCTWAILALAIVALSNFAQAATRTWDGGGADANWSTVNNWDGNVSIPANGDTVVFGTAFTSGTSISLNGDRTANSLTVSTTTGFSINNNTLTLTSGTLTRTDVAGTEADHTIASAISLGANANWVVNGSGTLFVSGGITGVNRDLNVDGAAAVTINSVIATGSGQVHAKGTGILTLTGANTYTDKTTIDGGSIINIRNSTALGTTAAGTTMGDGGTLQIQGGISVVGETLDIDNTGASGLGALRNISGNNSWSGAITVKGHDSRINSDADTLTISGGISLGKDLTIGGIGNTAISGVISAGGALTKADSGTVTLSGANTYGGITTVSGGVLRLDNTTAIPGGIGSAGGTKNLVISGGVIGLGANNFARGLGTGNAQVQLTGSGGFAAFTANRTVNLGGASGSVTWGTATFLPGTTTLILSHSTADATVDFQNPIVLGAAARTVQVDDGSAAVDAVLSGALTGAGGSLIKTGAGTLRLDSTGNNYTGGTTLSGGTLQLGASGVIPNTGTFAFSGGTLSANDQTEVIGALSLTANSGITLGTATARQDLTFASASRSGGTITIDNWVGTPGVGASANADRIIFNSNADTGSFLANVFWLDQNITGAQFIDLGGGSWELVPVPEPGTIFAGCMVVGIFGWTERGRLRRLFKKADRS